jgi:hypothetical protein
LLCWAAEDIKSIKLSEEGEAANSNACFFHQIDTKRKL